jgi:hypothetical protein
MAGTLDSATSRVANCETTLQHHSQQINSLNDSHSRILSQWDSFQQKWTNNQGSRGPAQDSGHAASFFLGGGRSHGWRGKSIVSKPVAMAQQQQQKQLQQHPEQQLQQQQQQHAAATAKRRTRAQAKKASDGGSLGVTTNLSPPAKRRQPSVRACQQDGPPPKLLVFPHGLQATRI